MGKIKVGVIGAGYWGPNLIRNFVELRDSQVVAVADLKDDRLSHIQAIYPQVSVTKNYKELFKMGLDAIVVATPPPTHYKFAQEVLQQGLHVLVEKPLALNSRDAEQLIDLAEQKNLILMVGHTFCYNAAVRTLKELIDRDEIGTVHYIDSARLNLGLFQCGLNVLWDLGPHDISIFSYVLGRQPISISAQGIHCVFEGIHDVIYLSMLFPDNILGHVHLSWIDPCKVRRVTVVGSKKMVVYNDIESSEKIRIYDKGVVTQVYADSFQEFQCSYRYGDLLVPNIRFVEPLKLECQDFLDCIMSGKEPCTNGFEGLKVVKVLEAAQHSLMNGNHHEEIKW
jgi:predicted dehydrogenase